MATTQDTADFMLDQMSGAGRLRIRKMFGEYAVYCNDKVVALICDEQLYVKPTDAGKKILGSVVEGEPYPGAKPYFLIDGGQIEDRQLLISLIEATAAALPVPKRKK